MSEPKPTKTKPKKVIGRSLAIALGIICVLLVAGLGGAMAYYTLQINNKDNTISSLNSEVDDLTSMVNLDNFTVWVNDTTVTQTASNYTSWFFSAGYAGYVSVNVQSSTTNNTYVRVIYSAFGVNYDNTTVVGTSGTAVFPVLFAPLIYMGPSKTVGSLPLGPSHTSIEIRVGNTNTVNNATESVTVTYYY